MPNPNYITSPISEPMFQLFAQNLLSTCYIPGINKIKKILALPEFRLYEEKRVISTVADDLTAGKEMPRVLCQSYVGSHVPGKCSTTELHPSSHTELRKENKVMEEL
jgi:hypothetical protein